MFLIRFFRSVAWLLNVLLALYSCLVYGLSYTVVIKHWFAGFLMLSLPLVLLANVFFLFFWLFNQGSKTGLSALMLFIAFPFWKRTFAWNETKECTKTLQVLSYNLMWFDVGGEDSEDTTEKIKTTALSTQTDIACFQEFFESETKSSFQTIRSFQEKYPYKASLKNYKAGSIGLITFSKYPILKSRSERFRSHNGLLQTDILAGKDTIRIINIQLHSMGVRVNAVIHNRKNYDVAKHEAKNIYQRLKDGFTERSRQVDILCDWIKQSPYPVIVCGDFNEIPYGYAYGKIAQTLQDAFVVGGRGFGFTYNKRPQFIRIDNQFCSKSVSLCKFEVIKKSGSDHYPILVEYSTNSE